MASWSLYCSEFHASCLNLQESDDEDDGDVQPFASLFGRLKPMNPTPRTSAAPKAKSKAKASAKHQAGRNKRNGAGNASEVQPEADTKKARVTLELAGDDAEVTKKFEEQLETCRSLQVPSHDEAVFSKWGKEKMQSLSEVRNQIYQKKKSLKRRKEGSDDLGSVLEDMMNEISKISDLVKKLCTGNPEGRQLYQMLESMPDVSASSAVWLRAVRAIAFDDLKLLKWHEFFSDTYILCKRHADGQGANAFFSLLASQLLQRLVKAVPVSKGVNAETIANLNSFVVIMTDPDHVRKTQTDGMSDEDHDVVMADVRSVLDFSAPPAQVENAVQSLASNTSHWAAVPFSLPQGVKVLDAARSNAKNKESISGILNTLNDVEESLRQSGLFSIDSVFTVGLQRCFTADHASMVSKCMKDLSPKLMKGLKGNDRDKLARVQKLAKSCVNCVICHHLVNELVPYLDALGTHIQEKKAFGTSLLTESSCIMHIADGCGHGEEALLQKLKDFSDLMRALATRLCGDNAVSEKEASSLASSWEAKSKAAIAAISSFMDRLASAGDDHNNEVRHILPDLKDRHRDIAARPVAGRFSEECAGMHQHPDDGSSVSGHRVVG